MQVRVLYSFDGQPGTGEISVEEGEVLNVTRQDVGEGWWEGTNQQGKTGLFPAAYVEELTTAPPSMPPPQLPSSYANTADFSDDWGFDSDLPATTTTQPSTNQQLQQTFSTFKPPATGRPPSIIDDEWSDEWEDDDSLPGTSSSLNGNFFQSQIARQGSQANSNAESAVVGIGKMTVDEIDKVYIDVGSTGAYWRRVGIEFTCSITSPRKESKFRGMKSFIAYTVTPTSTNLPVSRRYKHFDWLHERLGSKYSMIPIPPLPEKQISGRFEDDLIEYRMTMLQSWLDRLCFHPVLSRSQALDHFLKAPNDEKTWKAGKRRAEADRLVGGNLYQAVVRPDAPLDLIQTESKLEGYSRFFGHLDEATKLLQATCLDQAKKHQTAYKREYNKISHCFSKLSRAFDMDPSNCAPLLTEAIRHVSEAYLEIGTIFEQEPKHDWDPLSHLLYEYKGLIDGFPSIISSAKTSVAKRKQLEKDASEGKADHDALPPVIHRSDTVVYALHAEVANFHVTRERDFKRAMTNFLTEQISFYQKIADRLRDTLQHFNDI